MRRWWRRVTLTQCMTAAWVVFCALLIELGVLAGWSIAVLIQVRAL